MSAQYVLTLSCPDQIGIVSRISQFLAQRLCNITESAQFEDPISAQFFMRTTFESTITEPLATLETAFAEVAAPLNMQWRLADRHAKMRTLIMVSRLGHCLNDLLFRHSIGALPIGVCAIVSNHDEFAGVARQHGIPFHLLPVTSTTKEAQEATLEELIQAHRVELVVLARYMQILSDAFCARHPGKIINIHHSLLPSFKGAKPYHRAHERGVKLIGATAHYVTSDLDEGPIIEQGARRARHNHSPEQLVKIGRDVEAAVLSSAVLWHAERRVLLNGVRTVVFE